MKRVPKWCQSLPANPGQNTTLAFRSDLRNGVWTGNLERDINIGFQKRFRHKLDALGFLVRLRYCWRTNPHQPHITRSLSHKEMEIVDELDETEDGSQATVRARDVGDTVILIMDAARWKTFREPLNLKSDQHPPGVQFPSSSQSVVVW